MTNKQIIWEILSNARKSVWTFPPNDDRIFGPRIGLNTNCYNLLFQGGEPRQGMTEVVVERVHMTARGQKVPQGITTTVIVPLEYAHQLFRERDLIFFQPE